ncbi:hypothetical protein K438DRAFT_1879334 [Mycena galopus ATCC 62051]|nr:hypothetical protein K438DRAFT_1879334 [Mycena galopus ATCC 62051]
MDQDNTIAQYHQVVRAFTLNYAQVSSVAILVFDYALTFNLEVSLIWGSKWSLPKVLFLISRYSPVFDVPLALYTNRTTYIQIPVTITPAVSVQNVYFRKGGTAFGISGAQAILIVRTYALSGRRRSVGIIFTSIWAVGLSATIVLVVFFVRSTVYTPSPFQGIPGCYQAESGTTDLVIIFIMVFVTETMIMAYTLYLGITKYRDVRTPLVVTLYRDGITYYVCLCVVSFWNVFMLLDGRVFPKEALAQVLNTFLRVMHSVLSTRVLLHIRDVERKRFAEDFNGLLPTMGFELGTVEPETEI